MLCSLKFITKFAETGRTIVGEHEFGEGLSAISGPNESGKSMRLEMIRYALWGTAALRASASSYLQLQVRLSWKLGDDLYDVTRSLKSAELLKNGATIAIGTSPVNAQIRKAFGYDMRVFDMANAVLQGQVEALSNMKATERKTMVDKVIGLDMIDDIIKDVATLQTAQKMQVENLKASIDTELTEPVEPMDYCDCVGDLEQQESATWLLVQEKNKIESRIMALNCDKPGLEPYRTVEENLEDLIAGRESKKSILQQISVLSRKRGDCKLVFMDTPYTMEELQSYVDKNIGQQWRDYDNWRASLERVSKDRPKESEAELRQYMSTMDILPTLNKIKDLETNGSKIICPDCAVEINLQQDTIDELKASLPTQPTLMDEVFALEQSGYTKTIQIREGLAAWDRYNLFMAQPLVAEPDVPVIEEAQATLSLLLRNQQAEETLKNIEEELRILESNVAPILEYKFDEAIETRKKEDEAIRQHEEDVKNYDKFQTYVDETKDWLKNLLNCEIELKRIRDALIIARAYENEMLVYNTKKDINFENQMALVKATNELDELGRMRKALNDLKPRVKMFLVPSLNRVASNLLSQMTDGQRNKIFVNEEFDIWVDNQHIDTLSGSGKAAANLAIRIALGTVLTSKVFSVLLGDEVDAAMDDQRATSTAECLRNLTKNFRQVILISHKEPQADHQIKIGA